MRTGVSLSVTFADRARLRALVKDRNASQKHVWRAQIVLLTAEGVGTSAIMRAIAHLDADPLHRAEASAVNGSPFVLLRIRLAGVPDLADAHLASEPTVRRSAFLGDSRSTNMAAQSRSMI
jgi:hypothetical protein